MNPAGEHAMSHLTTGAGRGAPNGGAVEHSEWAAYFGESPRPIEKSPYDAYRHTNFALPDAYKGHSVYLTNVMITLITQADMWPASVALPFRVTEGEMSIHWNELIFNNHLLEPVPEEGVSRLVTQQQSAKSDSYIRYGLAMVLGAGPAPRT